MRRFTLTLLVLAFLAPLSALAADAVDFDMRVFQYNPATDSDKLLFADTFTVVKGVTATGFLVAFSTEIDVTEVDTSRTSLMVHAVTIGSRPTNYSRNFSVEYGLPARLTNIEGKNGAQYTLSMTPIGPRDVDTAGCSFSHQQGDSFKKDPTAYFDIYYVPRTLGDFYWNSVRAVIDQRYRTFRDLNHYNLPGKFALYLAPCKMYSVLWDDRFGTMVDPTRDNTFALFNKTINTADPFVIMQASVYKQYGYAPPFLTEGMAGYLSFAIFDMKRLVDEGRTRPIRELLDTYSYYTADPLVADRTAATFVKYLIDQYKIGDFLEVYDKADDLSLADVIEETYGKSVDALEGEWRTYVDTVRITFQRTLYFADIAETMRDYNLLDIYSRALLEQAATPADSEVAYNYLVRSQFFAGNYYDAARYQQQVVNIDDTVPRNWMALGAYNMMNGKYDEASEYLHKAAAMDTTDQMIKFNLALNYLYRGKIDTARTMLDAIVTGDASAPAGVESRIMLASLLFRSGDEQDRARAVTLCRQCIAMLQPQLEGGQALAGTYLWAGIAYLGAGDLPMGWDLLSVAQFLETRPFYQGIINLWMGKASDMRGEHTVARDYYGAVLSGGAADYHQQEAKVLLKDPFNQ